MKFSVLLPTRNGGPFLKDCISTILEDGYQDMELVVSDNANTDETQDVLRSFLGDSRLKVVRLEKVVSVTENWNNALKASSGDYFLMMGDDDCLLPGYFQRMAAVLKQYDDPDCVIYNAYTFVAPGSINDNKQGYYNKHHFKFGPDFKEGRLPAGLMRAVVEDMYRFRVRIPLNMQTTLVARRAADRYIPGECFHPPFPDHYLLNALLLNDTKWVYVPENLLVVGVSPKSFGHFVYSHQQEKGLGYLGIGGDFKGRLPGSELVNYMHVWLELLKKDFPEKLKPVRISRSGYVRRQVYHGYMQYKFGAISWEDFMVRFGKLSFRDMVGLLAVVVDSESWARVGRLMRPCKDSDPQGMVHGMRPLEGVRDIRAFKDWVIKNGS